MKIISFSDVITNSSSEVFILKALEGADKVRKDILEVHEKGYGTDKDEWSGMGGILDIADWTVFYISEAAKLWKIKKCMESGEWQRRIEDPEDDLTWDDVSIFYEKYPDLVEKEFSYTIEDWLNAMNITKEEASQLLYLDSDHSQKAIRSYIKDGFVKIIGGEFYSMTEKDNKFPYPGEAYHMMDGKGWGDATMEDPDFAKYILNQIDKSGISTFMDYSEYIK